MLLHTYIRPSMIFFVKKLSMLLKAFDPMQSDTASDWPYANWDPMQSVTIFKDLLYSKGGVFVSV